MNEQVISQLKNLLDAGDKEVGFVEYLPGDVAEKLLQSIRTRLDDDRETLHGKITEGLKKLPAPLAGVARGILS